MTVDRRKVVKIGAAFTVGAMIPGATLGGTNSALVDFNVEFDDISRRLKSTLNALGAEQKSALPIVSDDFDYNGGLRHDSDLQQLAMGEFVVQPCARIEDIEERDRPDVLPMFHECALRFPRGINHEESARLSISLLLEEFGLDPGRLAFVSVPQAKKLRPVFKGIGIDFEERTYIRDAAEALAARDSSGFFFQSPLSPKPYVTVGVYYRLGAGDVEDISAYPPPAGWSEIAEIVLAGPSGPDPILAIGVERLTLVTSGRYLTWGQRLETLFETIERDSLAIGNPPGIDFFR